jgi:hypothetical protein
MVVYPPVLVGLTVLAFASLTRRRRARLRTLPDYPDPGI